MQPNIYSQTPARKGLRHPRASEPWVERTAVPAEPAGEPLVEPNAGDMPRPIEPADHCRNQVAASRPIEPADHCRNQVELRMLAILTSPALPGETAVIAFRRK